MTYEEFRAYLAGLSADDVDAITPAVYRVLKRKMRFRAALQRLRWCRCRYGAGDIAGAVNARGREPRRATPIGGRRSP